MKKKTSLKNQPIAAKQCQTFVNKPFSTTLYLVTKLPYSLKALNTYKRGILVVFFLL